MAKAKKMAKKMPAKMMMAKKPSKMNDGFLASLTAFVGRDMGISLWLGVSTAITLLLASNLLASFGAAQPPLLIGKLLILFFTLRFLFAPLIDKLPAPLLVRKFGGRRAMALCLQLLSILLLVAVFLVRKSSGIDTLVIGALAVVAGGFHIMALEGLRVEMLPAKKQAHGIAMAVLGYFLFNIIVISSLSPWLQQIGFDLLLVFALLQLVGLWVIAKAPMLDNGKFAWRSLGGSLFAPFADIFKQKNIIALLAFFLLYKYGNSFMILLSTNFYNGVGFQEGESLQRAAGIVQTMGPLLGLVGLILAAIVVYCFGVYRALMVGMVLILIAPIFFPILLRVGPNLTMLFFTVAMANISAAFSTGAVLALAAKMVNPKHSITQWAFLTSILAFAALPSIAMVPTISGLPLINQFLLALPTGNLLQLLKIASPNMIALMMVILSVPGLLLLLAIKKNLATK